MKDIVGIEDEHKVEAIRSLLKMHKFQHTIQIIRYFNKSGQRYDYDSYHSVSGALAMYIIEESNLAQKMKRVSAYTNLIGVLLNDKRTLKSLSNLDAETTDNIQVVDQKSNMFTSLKELIAAARVLKA